jgi:hypothetical protein
VDHAHNVCRLAWLADLECVEGFVESFHLLVHAGGNSGCHDIIDTYSITRVWLSALIVRVQGHIHIASGRRLSVIVQFFIAIIFYRGALRGKRNTISAHRLHKFVLVIVPHTVALKLQDAVQEGIILCLLEDS